MGNMFSDSKYKECLDKCNNLRHRSERSVVRGRLQGKIFTFTRKGGKRATGTCTRPGVSTRRQTRKTLNKNR